MDISGVWGYGAVFVAQRNFYQGFGILDPDSSSIAPHVAQALDAAALAKEMWPASPPEGHLAGLVAELVVTQEWEKLPGPVSAISKILGQAVLDHRCRASTRSHVRRAGDSS